MDRFYTDGYLHWKNRFAVKNLKIFQDLNNFAQGFGIFGFILTSVQLQKFFRIWFASSKIPPNYYIWVIKNIRGVSAIKIGKSIY
ncbi:hypothetical protein PoMZ_09187 [Pyricularia oryzae]|uniref:Uncharacterized protein n=1 Tax=Pyricularia oryzae TaxID=318829 RepID=A0A4P7MTJ5_PYROR|nr:hypothetical protein PoMZ_09187 [Pyricularia oryzae]